jgi:hypothetical protein
MRMTGEIELWKPVVGFEGTYEISNFGRARSVDRSVTQMHGHGHVYTRRLKGVMLKHVVSSHGYPAVNLPKLGPVCVHILVLTAFVGACPDGQRCLHWDGNKLNPRLGNLRWGTQKENMEDASRHGTLIRGVTVGGAKLDDEKVRVIKHSGRSSRDLSQAFGVSRGAINAVRRGRNWGHVA